MAVVTVSSKGSVVIPAEFRRQHGIGPGSKLRIIDYGGVLSLVPIAKDSARQGAGMLESGRQLTEILLAEHRVELDRQDWKPPVPPGQLRSTSLPGWRVRL